MYDSSNPELQSQFHQGFIRGVETDPSYPRHFPVGQEDFMLERIDDAVRRDLLDDAEGHELFISWIAKRRPDTVIVVQQRVARPFYE